MTALPDGTRYHAQALDAAAQRRLIGDLAQVLSAAPFYRPAMPRSGKPFSILMSNCGALGWVADKTGYRYQATHPATGTPWPPIPSSLLDIWSTYAEYEQPPEACLINLYTPGTQLGSHVDADEENRAAPVVSVSLGADAVFHVGGLTRTAPKTRLTLRSGDVLVLAGASRDAYHGIDRVLSTTRLALPPDLAPDGGRINLTMRRVRP